MSYHRITAIGHAGSDPDQQITFTGKEVTNFPLYINERFGGNNKTIRYKVKAWSNLGQIVAEHLNRGQLVVVEGTPSIEVWQNGEGEPRAQMVITAQNVRFLGSKPMESKNEDDESE